MTKMIRKSAEELQMEGVVIETYMEGYIFKGFIPDHIKNISNLEIILKFLIREKRIEKRDLFMNMWRILTDFKLNTFIEGKSFKDYDVQQMLARI